MKRSRAAALGLVVAICLASVPAVFAADVDALGGRGSIVERGGWLDRLLERMVGWLGWEDAREGAQHPRSTLAPAKPDDGGFGVGQTTTGNCDEGSGMDPVGNPCAR